MFIARSAPLLFGLILAACSAGTRAAPASPAAVYTADGKVLGVERASPEDPATYVQLVIQGNEAAPVRVELAPGWYLDQRGLSFRPETRVAVEGHRVVRNGEPLIVARSVSVDGSKVLLRDERDRPLWEP